MGLPICATPLAPPPPQLIGRLKGVALAGRPGGVSTRRHGEGLVSSTAGVANVEPPLRRASKISRFAANLGVMMKR